MKTLLSMVTVMATALMLAATSPAVGEAKNQSRFTAVLNVVRIQVSKELLARSEALGRRYHLGVFGATGSAPNYQALKERI
jgi:hypothetical protein